MIGETRDYRWEPGLHSSKRCQHCPAAAMIVRAGMFFHSGHVEAGVREPERTTQFIPLEDWRRLSPHAQHVMRRSLTSYFPSVSTAFPPF